MTSLEVRKQLLIAESELNRRQLREEWRMMAGGVRSLTGRAKTAGSLASAVAMLVAGILSFKRARRRAVAGRPSWLRTLIRTALLARSIWSRLRDQPKSY
ncbi:MAG TPA: hypothetical protein VK731_04570 [Candidatus Cybelea sp.]|nr:hypothetical protein [Candidatus Cybelea sp.]